MTGEEAPERHIAQTLEEQKMLELVRRLGQQDREAFVKLLASRVPKQPGKVGRKPKSDTSSTNRTSKVRTLDCSGSSI
jgi:hypothetical protein